MRISINSTHSLASNRFKRELIFIKENRNFILENFKSIHHGRVNYHLIFMNKNCPKQMILCFIIIKIAFLLISFEIFLFNKNIDTFLIRKERLSIDRIVSLHTLIMGISGVNREINSGMTSWSNMACLSVFRTFIF